MPGTVEGDGGFAEVGLHEDDVDVALGGDLAQHVDGAGGDAAAAVGFEHGEIVDVDLAPVLLELVELVGGKAADHGVAIERGDGDEMRLGEEAGEIGVARNACW